MLGSIRSTGHETCSDVGRRWCEILSVEGVSPQYEAALAQTIAIMDPGTIAMMAGLRALDEAEGHRRLSV